MPKKLIINRKVKRTRKKIITVSIMAGVGICLLLLVTVGLILTKAKIISPVSLTVQNKKIYFIDSHLAEQKIKELLDKYNISFSEVTTGHDIIRIALKDDSQALLSPNKNIENQIASLQLLTNNFTIEGKVMKRIDLRFDKPVVVFTK